MNLVVMYHYVRPRGVAYPAGIRPLMLDEFEAQLDWLSERYDIVGASELLRRLPRESARPACLLTFDDGTRDHAEVAAPALARRGLSGVFFVLTGPIKDRLMPLTHAVHWLLSQDEELVWAAFRDHAQKHLGGDAALGDPAVAKRFYHYETETRGRIKYAANVALPPEATQAVVRAAIDAAGTTTEELAEEWFASAEQVREMHRAGMTIASHGVSHTSAVVLGPSGIRREMLDASAELERLLGEKPTWFACPFGGTGATAETVKAIDDTSRELGIEGGVSTVKGLADARTDPLAIPRLDCIDVFPRGSWLDAVSNSHG